MYTNINITINYNDTSYQRDDLSHSLGHNTSSRLVDEKNAQPSDHVKISDEAKEQRSKDKIENNTISDVNQFTDKEKREIEELKTQNQAVKTHEMAHVAAGVGIVRGGPHYSYKIGPDGKRYAVGGHVRIDTSPEKEPEDTVRKMQRVKQAALAPIQPSVTDRAVAAKASQTEAKAREEIAKERIEKAIESYMKLGQERAFKGVYEISNEIDKPLSGRVMVIM